MGRQYDFNQPRSLEMILEELNRFDPISGADPVAYADAVDALGDQPLVSGNENLVKE